MAKLENGERRLDAVEPVALVDALGDETTNLFARYPQGAATRH